MRRVLSVCVIGAVVLLTGACHQTGSAGAAPARAAAPAAQRWVMPNLVGMQLQQAQNAVRQLTGKWYLTVSHDASGQRRMRLVYTNWRVCTQSVKPGATITRE